MILIDADALLKKTINNPLHVPYITKKDVIDMPSALNNQVNLCDSCTYTYPECPSEKDDVIFGNGIGNDNICACNKYQPTVQPVATDTNVGDKISRQAAIDVLKQFKPEIIPYEKARAYVEETIDTMYNRIEELPTIQPEPKEGEWIPVHPLQGDDPGAYMCSKCKTGMWEIRPSAYHYCPNCGAHMRGEKDG